MHMITLPFLETQSKIYSDLISDETLSYHYSKHHNAYVLKLNELLTSEGKEYSEIEHVLSDLNSFSDTNKTAIFNNAGQVYNHNKYWLSMTSLEDSEKTKENALELINGNFGNFENFAQQWKNAGLAQFGSGWVWLVQNTDGKLEIQKTSNADTPLLRGYKCLIVMDVWEHAYYLDTKNDRGSYIENFLKLINWNYLLQQL
jgi:superoxide dismutase, Fe-Mn family